jgi:uroporphyrinogen decarboxylase
MAGSTEIPYLLRATRGEKLDRPPVWMMRQAGRYMKVYRDLRKVSFFSGKIGKYRIGH